LDLLRLID